VRSIAREAARHADRELRPRTSATSAERYLPAVVDQAVAHDARERRQPVRLGGRRARDVPDLVAAGDEGVGDELAVAAPGHGLGAHDGRRALAGEGLETGQLVPELRRIHVVGVGAEARGAPTQVR